MDNGRGFDDGDYDEGHQQLPDNSQLIDDNDNIGDDEDADKTPSLGDLSLAVDNEKGDDDGKKGSGMGGGFIMANGVRRKYGAPEPPIKELHWEKAYPVLHAWAYSVIQKKCPMRTFDIESDDAFMLMEGVPDDDFFDVVDTANTVRETEEVLRPYAIGNEDGSAATWGAVPEADLLQRGIKLADSFAITVDLVDGESTKFGIRSFHIGYRYFFYVVLGGEFGDGDTRSKMSECNTESGKEEYEELVTFEGRPFVAFYYGSITHKEAEMNKCI
jgi:hypothetical protein